MKVKPEHPPVSPAEQASSREILSRMQRPETRERLDEITSKAIAKGLAQISISLNCGNSFGGTGRVIGWQDARVTIW